MNRHAFRGIARAGVVAVLAGLAGACDAEKKTTPPEVLAHYHALLDTLNADTPGASAEQLAAFKKSVEKYQIADSVQVQLNLFRAETMGRYLKARELAREGEFDQAERMLKDLALVPLMPDGQSARTHLEFEFYMEKARWLLVRQQFEESRAVAQMLLSRNLNRFQIDEVEKILDYTGHVDAAIEMGARQDARNACRQLMVLLANVYVNDGGYPVSLSIADLDKLDPYSNQAIARALASIDDYKASRDHYSFVAVSKSGERFHIADGMLEE